MYKTQSSYGWDERSEDLGPMGSALKAALFLTKGFLSILPLPKGTSDAGCCGDPGPPKAVGPGALSLFWALLTQI